MSKNKIEKCICGHQKIKHRRKRGKKFLTPCQNPYIYCECSICNCKKYKYDGKSKELNKAELLIKRLKLNIRNPFNFFNPLKSSRRELLGVITSVLLACQKPINLTSIMYESNVNFTVLKIHIKKLIKIKFIEKINDKQKGELYKLTLKGEIFLDHLSEMKSLWNEEQ